LNESENVIVEIVPPISIGQQLKDLTEPEIIRAIQLQFPNDHNNESAFDGRGLDIKLIEIIVDTFEGKPGEFFINALQPLVFTPLVTETGTFGVEIDESWSIGHHGLVVRVEEGFDYFLAIHYKQN